MSWPTHPVNSTQPVFSRWPINFTGYGLAVGVSSWSQVGPLGLESAYLALVNGQPIFRTSRRVRPSANLHS